MIRFFVPGIPVAKGSAKAFYNKRSGRAMIVQDNRERQKGWASSVSYTAHESGCKPMSGPVGIEVFFTMPRPKSHYGTGRNADTLKDAAPDDHISKPDLDKLIRCVKDALTGIAWKDDSQVCNVFAGKAYGDNPGAWIAIFPKERVSHTAIEHRRRPGLNDI